jgi:hypothetical protein
MIIIPAVYGQVDHVRRVHLTGNIKDEKEKPVSYAHIMEVSRYEGWISDYYGEFSADPFPGDTLIISAVSYHHAKIYIPRELTENEFHVEVILHAETVELKELVVYPWPGTYDKLRREFLKIEIDDPADDVALYLPPMKDIINKLKTPGVPGQIGLYSGPGPFSILYDQFSREAKSKRLYAEIMKKEKAEKRFNSALVTRITGLKKEDDIKKFMEFCALQVKFILESTDYELYAAVLNCYHEFCEAGMVDDTVGN